MNREEIVMILVEAGIPLDQWGVGKAKSIDHLVKEVKEGETTFEGEGTTLLRVVKTAAVVVFYIEAGRLLVLSEDHQVFRDGRERTLERESSISEKIMPGERPNAAAQRAFKEELGITEPQCLYFLFRYTKGPIDQGSYPGLLTRYDIEMYSVLLSERHFRPEGYVEKGEGKTSYFVWKHATLSGKPWIPSVG